MRPAARIRNIQKSAIRRIFDSAPADSINLGLGEIQFSLADFLKQKAQKLIDTENLSYTPNAGLIDLRKAICAYYQIAFNDNVCVSIGAEEALFAALFSYLNPGDEALIADPTFLAYKNIIEMTGAVTRTFSLNPFNNFRLKENTLNKAINATTKVVILNNPSNPLGISFSLAEIEIIIKTCKKHDLLLIVDEVYRELFLEKRIRSFLAEDADVIVVSSLSKSHCMAGWRVGWAISNHKDLISPIIKSHQYICTCAPAISQHLATIALAPEGMSVCKEIRRKLNYNRKIAVNLLDRSQIDFLSNDTSPYIFAKVKGNDLLIANQLSKLGVIIIPGSAFGENGSGYIRLSYGLDEKILRSGLGKVIEYLQKI